MKKYLFIPLSGLGYLFPSVRLAKILEAHNHKILFATTIDYSLMLQSLGIENIGVRNNEVPFLYTGTWYYNDKAPNEVAILERVINHFQPDVIVTNSLVMSSFIVAEKYQIPVINIGFNEYLYPSLDQPNNKKWRLKSLTDYYNGYRKALDMNEIPYSITDSPLIGNVHLLRSTPELDNAQQLPQQVDYIGDLYWEPPYHNLTLQHFIEQSKAANRPLVYVQMGRLFEEFKLWEKLLTIWKDFPVNFIVDIGRSDYIEPQVVIPPNFYLNPFIPIGAVAKDIDFVICTGQSTSVVSAIVHGKQLLVIPHSADSQEFAQKVSDKKLGISFLNKEALNTQTMQQAFEQLQQNTFLHHIQYYQQHLAQYTDEVIYEKIARF